jgi:2'-5' RNA ligase
VLPAWHSGAKTEAAQRWHLTLHFIGAVPAERLGRIAAGIAVPGRRFELQLTALECWPRGLVVLRPAEVPEALHDLHARVGAALQRLELPLERRAFRPHLTLARRALCIEPAPLAAPIRWPVHGYSLVLSDGTYRRIADYPLR